MLRSYSPSGFSPLAWVVPLGASAIALAILLFGAWTLPALLVAVIAALGIYRVDWAFNAVVFLLPVTAVEGMSSGYNHVVQDFKKVLLVWLICAWVVHLLVKRTPATLPRNLAIALAVLVLAAVASILRAPQPGIALTSTARLVSYAAVYVVITINLVRTPADVWRVVRLLLVSAALTAAFALYQLGAYFVGWPTLLNPSYLTVYAIPRVHSWMTEPLHLSNFLVLCFPLALAMFAWRERRSPRLAFAAVVLCLSGIVVAASRAGWGTLAVTLVLFGLLSAGCTRPLRLAQVGSVVVLLAVLAGSTIWLRAFGSTGELLAYVREFATFAGDETGVGDLNGRIQNLKLAARAVETSPVIGIGTNNVGFRFHQYMTIEGPKISSSGNTYLDTWLETGAVGLAALVTMLVTALASAWRGFRAHRLQPEGAVLFGLFVGLLGSSLHINFYGSLSWGAHLFFAIGFTLAAERAFRGDAVVRRQP